MSSVSEIARQYWAAAAARDVDSIVELFTEDALWAGPNGVFRGHDEIRHFCKRNAAEFPRLEVSVGRVIGGDTEAAIEWGAAFTDAAGEDFTASGVHIMRRAGERLCSLTAYWEPPSRKAAECLAGVPGAGRFADKHVLVTGGGSGIGAATAQRFVAEGARVTAVDLNADGLDHTAAGIAEGRQRFTPVVADITTTVHQRELIRRAANAEGALDVLVNNAAVFLLAGLEATPGQWQRTLDVNLLAPAQLVAAAADAMTKADGAAVVNVASVSGHISQADRWTYNASKGGILALTRCQALDLAGRGIRVNSISPGYVWTEVLDRAAGGDRAKWEPVWGSACPLRRCAEPYEIAAGITFLASADASFITGSDLLVDGGLVSMSPDGQQTFEFGS